MCTLSDDYLSFGVEGGFFDGLARGRVLIVKEFGFVFGEFVFLDSDCLFPFNDNGVSANFIISFIRNFFKTFFLYFLLDSMQFEHNFVAFNSVFV